MLGFFTALPGAAAQGIIWGIMAIGVYITYRVLDLADLTVDGSFGTGGAVLVMCTISGMDIKVAMLVAVLAGCLAGLATGIWHSGNSFRNSYPACALFREFKNFRKQGKPDIKCYEL